MPTHATAIKLLATTIREENNNNNNKSNSDWEKRSEMFIVYRWQDAIH